MADTDALKRSELVIVRVLDLAMTKGIQEWRLHFSDLKLRDDFAPYFYPCVRWLEAEGIIRVGKYSPEISGPAAGHVSNVVLTAYGMNILGHRIQVGSDSLKIADAVEKVSSAQPAYANFGEFFGGLLGSFTKSIGS